MFPLMARTLARPAALAGLAGPRLVVSQFRTGLRTLQIMRPRERVNRQRFTDLGRMLSSHQGLTVLPAPYYAGDSAAKPFAAAVAAAAVFAAVGEEPQSTDDAGDADVIEAQAGKPSEDGQADSEKAIVEALTLSGHLSKIMETIEGGGTTVFCGYKDESWFYEIDDEELKERKEGDYDYDDDEEIIITNQERFREQILALQADFPEQSQAQLENLIAICTERGAYTLLQTLAEQEFGLTDKLKDNPILTHPNGKIVEGLLDKFHKRGLLKRKHLPMMVALQLAEAKVDACSAGLSFPVATHDDEAFNQEARALFEVLRLKLEQKKVASRDYANVVIFGTKWSSMATSPGEFRENSRNNSLQDEYQQDYDRCFEAMKKEVLEKNTSTLYGNLCGIHYSSFIIHVVRGESGQLKVQYLHVDSLGTTRGDYTGSELLASLMRVFPDAEFELFNSSETTQYTGSGCSYHAPHSMKQLIELPEWLVENEPGYKALAETMSRQALTFHYLRTHVEYQSDVRVNFFAKEDMELYQHGGAVSRDKIKHALVSYSGSLLPLHVTARFKESLKGTKTKSYGSVYHRNSEPPYALVSTDKYVPSLHEEIEGQWGLFKTRTDGSRQSQWRQPVGTHGSDRVTLFEQAVGHQVREETREVYGEELTKEFNTGVDQYRLSVRAQLTQFLLEMPKEQLDKLPETFSPAAFEAQVHQRLGQKGPNASVKCALVHTFWQVIKKSEASSLTSPVELKEIPGVAAP